MRTSSVDKKAAYPFALIPIFIWIGFVCSISFMEAWLKFRAPNVSLPIGLSIGRLVFAALNKVEWALAGLTFVLIFLSNHKSMLMKSAFLYIPLAILIFQSAILLPFLNERAEAILQGMHVAPSFMHLYYIFFEAVKVLSLFMLGLNVIWLIAKKEND